MNIEKFYKSLDLVEKKTLAHLLNKEGVVGIQPLLLEDWLKTNENQLSTRLYNILNQA